MPFEQKEDSLIFRHAKGPTVEILWYGATILPRNSGSKSNPALSERILVSSKSPLDGSEPSEATFLGAALDPVPSITAIYDKSFHLDYVVTLSEYTLKTNLHVTNTSSATPFEFRALFHTYHTVEDRDGVDVTNWTGSVYESAPGTYEARWLGGGVDVTTNMEDLVVWNPQAITGQKIVAMEEGGWDKLVCVEPGLALAFEILQPGENWIGKQEITVK
ncbi:galactose mutarotase-like protein [Desarmillaria ectypa]|nr:galactose mutarotase-like protein [Desarmillaria ectypa]